MGLKGVCDTFAPSQPPPLRGRGTPSIFQLADDGKVLVGDDLKKAKVEAEVLYSDKSDKVIVYKYKAKKNERKRQGHRQPYTALKILSIKK